MKRIIVFGSCMLWWLPLSAAVGSGPTSVSNVFDRFSGQTLDTTFEEVDNWVIGSFYGLAPHSGSQYFETDNGNFNHDFLSERYVKQLGGTIQFFPYQVSFFIAANSLGGIGLNALELSDFSELAIGGAGGNMVWLNTPTPSVGQGWVEWTGHTHRHSRTLALHFSSA